jgi:ectoine hydroxylase-related dioxygenase (phytanoyl-CoA dioxygenase family)
MYYLTDTTVEKGCLRVLPGTHRKVDDMHRVLSGITAHSDEVRNQDVDNLGPEHSNDVPGSVDVCVQAGDVVIGDNRVLHGARQNCSNERRTVITVWYHPHYGDLPPRVTHDFIAPVHVAFASPIYHMWSASQLADARSVGILPPLHGHELLAEGEMDADNHSLQSFDRVPRLDRMVRS